MNTFPTSASSSSRFESEQTRIAQVAEQIIRLLEQGRAETGLSRADFFTQALLVWDATLRQADMHEFLNVACVGVELAMDEISDAFDELLFQASHNYYDILGVVFMLNSLHKREGEEYTPWDLVRLMVRLQMVGFTPRSPGEAPYKIYDPCCGSGAFLLGALEYIDDYYPEMLDQGMIKLYGQEASYIGWLMCRVNLRLHDLGRCFRRPLLHAEQPPAEPEIQRSPPRSMPIQPDITIDRSMGDHLHPPDHLPRSAPNAEQHEQRRPVPYGLGPLFSQFELPWQPETKTQEE